MDRNPVTGVVVAGVAALLVVIGSVLPWISLSTPIGSIGFSGTDGHLIGSGVDGTVTLVLGLIVGACCGFSLVRSDRVLPVGGLLVACATAGIAVYDLVDVGDRVSRVRSVPFASVSIGYGLWITALAAFGMIVGALMTLSAGQRVAPRIASRAVPVTARPAGRPEAQEYWAQDPFGRHELRWWNGNTYTDKVMDEGVESTDAPGRRRPAQTSSDPAVS